MSKGDEPRVQTDIKTQKKYLQFFRFKEGKKKTNINTHVISYRNRNFPDNKSLEK